MLNTVYYYNGKLFSLRRGEHRNITVNNFEVGSNYSEFKENVSKTFHGGLCDMKYVPRKVRHVCHKDGEKHERCLVELYKEYIDFIKIENCKVDAFYFRPLTKGFGFAKSPVGVNTLSKILPDMCKAIGVKVKMAHCLRVSCATALFQQGVAEKLIPERTGHKSNALFRYEKASEGQTLNVSRILAPSTSFEVENSTQDEIVCSKSSTCMSTNVVENENVISFMHLKSCACDVIRVCDWFAIGLFTHELLMSLRSVYKAHRDSDGYYIHTHFSFGVFKEAL